MLHILSARPCAIYYGHIQYIGSMASITVSVFRERVCVGLLQADGTILGIDFGLAFGAGATTTVVPELLPFRYSGPPMTVI